MVVAASGVAGDARAVGELDGRASVPEPHHEQRASLGQDPARVEQALSIPLEPAHVRVPPGVQLIPIDPKSGLRAPYGDQNVILEAFKPGEQPATKTAIIGEDLVPAGGQEAVIEGGLTTGTGGLY